MYMPVKYSKNPHKRATAFKNLQPKILQIPINKVRNFDLDWFSRETGSFLSREEEHFSMHTKQDKISDMTYYPKLSIHMTFIRTLLA